MSDAYKHKHIGGRKGKMRLAHHLIWEKNNGSIPEGFQIHHLDENKSNNDIENLIMLSVSDHRRIHSPYMGRLNGEWMHVCPECKNIGKARCYALCNECRARKARIERRLKKENL